MMTPARRVLRLLLSALLLFAATSLVAEEAAAQACGAPGQRACCLFEAPFGACQSGAIEVPGCSGDCTCSSGATAISHCEAPTPCGGVDQRACCVGEAAFGACQAGLVEEPVGMSTGTCTNLPSSQSGGYCRATTPCGDDGQRACCVGEAAFGACQAGLAEVAMSNAGQCSNLAWGIQSSSVCQAVTACGGPGERACCATEAAFGACDTGTKEVPGCDGDCLCETGATANSTCVVTSACGGPGQRACCVGEGTACNGSAIEIPGCSGDCFCGPGAALGTIMSTSTCAEMTEPGQTTLYQIPEPQADCVNCNPPIAPATDFCSPRGVADMHAHMFADKGHGGAAFVGNAYDPSPGGDVNTALAQDYGTSANIISAFEGGLPLPLVDDDVAPDCPDYLKDTGACDGQRLWHGDHTPFDDPTGTGSNDEPGAPLGAPVFNGWPTHKSSVHQQMYYKWLERAWRGGLRLMVMQAVHSEAFCEVSVQVDGVDCTDSMGQIDLQLQAAWDFQAWLDAQEGGAGKGWFRIVQSPNQARLAIQQGKLAVVLGIEVDNLFNCKADIPGQPPSACPNMPGHPELDTVQKAIDFYYDWGVRHVFPVHNFDNKFAGTATWLGPLASGNRFVEGLWPETQECADGPFGEFATYGQRFSQTSINFLYSLACDISNEILGRCIVGSAPAYDTETTCNTKGLTPAGYDLIDRLVAKGMIIDIDHMSNESLQNTLVRTEGMEGAGGYPLVASHGLFLELHEELYGADTNPGGGIGQEGRHERLRTHEQLQSLGFRQGLVAIMLMDDVQIGDRAGEKQTLAYDSGLVPGLPGTHIDDDCRHSSKSWGQAYEYAVDTLFGDSVAIGSDWNGVAAHLGPRFGSGGCGGETDFVDLTETRKEERSAQERFSQRVPYPFTTEFGTFLQQTTGQKSWDVNTDGLAHVGLLPDFFKDLEMIGFTQPQLDPLMTSANAYIEVWERGRNEICVPEPEGLPIALLGLGVLGALRRRREADAVR